MWFPLGQVCRQGGILSTCLGRSGEISREAPPKPPELKLRLFFFFIFFTVTSRGSSSEPSRTPTWPAGRRLGASPQPTRACTRPGRPADLLPASLLHPTLPVPHQAPSAAPSVCGISM